MKKYILFSLIFLLSITFSFLIWFYLSTQPLSSKDSKQVNFMINKGDSLTSISRRLENSKIIKNNKSFIILSYMMGLDKKLQSGNFIVSPGQSTKEIIQRLSQAGTHDYWLQILGGMRNEEVVEKFPESIPFSTEEFLSYSVKEQGYLFPDSYLIPEFYSPEQIVDLIKKNFDIKLNDARKDSPTITLSDEEVIILASLAEREGRSLESKQHIVGILLNRLDIDMPLQIDASVQYARDTKYPPQKYWEPLQKKDMTIASPYNTYLNRGLTPGPICNPGFDSIYAVFHPIDSEYLFYITGNDNKMHYATTLDEHNQNISKYLR